MKWEGARLLIVTFVFYVSNLSWNTTDDTLRNVRQIFSGSAYVIMFLILSSPQIIFLIYVDVDWGPGVDNIKAFEQYGSIVDVRSSLLPVLCLGRL